jgi:hypothetical protein
LEKSGDRLLARDCLKRALALSPFVLAAIAADPRLAVRMAALTVLPGGAQQGFTGPVKS